MYLRNVGTPLTAVNPRSSVVSFYRLSLSACLHRNSVKCLARSVAKVTEIVTHCSQPLQCEAASVYEEVSRMLNVRH
jgi:hypothetical protein